MSTSQPIDQQRSRNSILSVLNVLLGTLCQGDSVVCAFSAELKQDHVLQLKILPIPLSTFPIKSISSKLYPFTESDEEVLEKLNENIVGAPSVMFTSKAVVDETLVRKSSDIGNLVNFTHFLCVSPNKQDFLEHTNLTKIWKHSNKNQTRREVFKIWSPLVSSEPDPNAKQRTSAPREHIRY